MRAAGRNEPSAKNRPYRPRACPVPTQAHTGSGDDDDCDGHGDRQKIDPGERHHDVPSARPWGHRTGRLVGHVTVPGRWWSEESFFSGFIRMSVGAWSAAPPLVPEAFSVCQVVFLDRLEMTQDLHRACNALLRACSISVAWRCAASSVVAGGKRR